MFCTSCRRYQRALPQGPAPYCTGCGGATEVRGARELEEDLGKLGFLVGEMELWLRNGAVAAEVRQTLLPEYVLQLELAREHRRWVAGWKEEESARDAEGEHERDAEPDPGSDRARSSTFASADPPRPWPAADAAAAGAPAPAAALGEPTAVEQPFGLGASPPDAHYAHHAHHAPDLHHVDDLPPSSGAGRLMREVRPLVYENFILFLGAFLVFAGSLYFAIYFWERLGSFGPLVAGSLLGVYASGFAGMGYLLQRRYRAELSARVLFGIATAIYPIAVTLAGEPLAHAGPHRPDPGLWTAASQPATPLLLLVSGAAVMLWTAAAYPAITVAASLFQREIARPFTRAFLSLLLALGLAPLLLGWAPRPASVAFLYVAALPLAAMYRRVREIGRVYEPATVLYVVAGSAYLLLAIAVRVALLPGAHLALAELAPLAVLLATAAIDLDVEWRRGPRGVRSALGSAGVLAHAVAVLAIVLAFSQPVWRVLTTLGAGALFAVAALRHRRPAALHLALATLTLGLFLVLWLPALAPHSWQPRALGFAGALLLPWSLALTQLAARWRRNAAPEYAAPVERWVLICAALTALATLAPLQDHLRLWHGRSELRSAALPALIMLPATVVTQLLAWRWSRRPAYLTFATSLAVIAALIACRLAGLHAPALALLAAALACAVALASLRARGAEARHGLRDAAIGLFLLITAAVVGARAWEAPLPLVVELAALVVLAATALAIAAGSRGASFGLLAQLLLGGAAALGLLQLIPAHYVAGVLALAWLALDRLASPLQLGQARPFRHAQVLAWAALTAHLMHLVTHLDEPGRPLPPLEPALVALFTVARWRLGGSRLAIGLFAHLALAALALTGVALALFLHIPLHSYNAFGTLGAGLAPLVLGELLLLGSADERNLLAARAAFSWAAIALAAGALTRFDDLPHVPLGATLSSCAFVVYLGRAHRHGLSLLPSLAGPLGLGDLARRARLPILSAASGLAAQHLALHLLSRAGLLEDEALSFAVLSLIAAATGWAHWRARARLSLDEPRAVRFVTPWLGFAALLALASGTAAHPALADTALAALSLVLAGVFFSRAAVRDPRLFLGAAAWLAFALLLLRLRLSPIAAALHFPGAAGAGVPELDAITLVALAFACHLIGELLERAKLSALARPAPCFVVALPLLAAALALAEPPPTASLRHALLFESIGVVYLLSFWRGGPRPLAFLAACFLNAGLFLLWLHTDHRDPLFYAIPAGASIVGLARIYRDNLGPGARRGLHFAGCLLIYFSTYYRVMQFDSGLYPLLLGGLALTGVALGFALQLRDLFLMSAGFLVLDVISNLAFYGVHRPLLGWTLLTATGLGLTAAGVLFQLRRAELTALLNRIRAHLHAWE